MTATLQIKTKAPAWLWWICQRKSPSNEKVSIHFCSHHFLLLTVLRLHMAYQLGQSSFFLQCKLDMNLIYFFQVVYTPQLIIRTTISKKIPELVSNLSYHWQMYNFLYLFCWGFFPWLFSEQFLFSSHSESKNMVHNLHTKLFLTPMHILKAEGEDYDLPLLLKGFWNRVTAAPVARCLQWK